MVNILYQKLFHLLLKVSAFPPVLHTCENAYEPRHDKTCLRESPTRPDTNWPAQLQRLARVLKFRL